MNIKYLFNDFPFQEPVLITFVAELSFSTKANNIDVLNIGIYISLASLFLLILGINCDFLASK